VRRHRVVRVPASSANLGPGFDVLAAALSPVLELEVQEADAPGSEVVVECDLPGVPCDRSNLCVQAFSKLHTPDGLSFSIRSQIPMTGGLGSSAAAIVAGLVAADHMFELDAPLYELATELEGHPDNVAAALYGGFVVCAPDGPPVRFEPAPGMEAVIAIPPDPVRTADARAAMPPEVPIGDAVYTASHASLLVLGLARGDLDLVARGLGDRLHQPRRAHLYPRSMELLAQARDLGAVGASISGAGPTVLFWCHWQQTGPLHEALRAAAPDCEVRRVQFVPGGADVRAL
jgi:homoserine kinase